MLTQLQSKRFENCCYVKIGKGFPIVLLHGFAEDHHIWQAQIDFSPSNRDWKRGMTFLALEMRQVLRDGFSQEDRDRAIADYLAAGKVGFAAAAAAAAWASHFPFTSAKSATAGLASPRLCGSFANGINVR